MNGGILPMLIKENGLDYLTLGILLLYWITAVMISVQQIFQ